MYLFGDQGRGKSCAAAWVYRVWPGSALWCDTSDWIGKVLRCRRSEDGRIYEEGSVFGTHESGLLRRIESADLAVFDDVGIRGASEAAFEIFYQFVQRRHRKPTIYVSNLEPFALLDALDGRIASRLMSGEAIHVTGPDLRLVGKRIRQA